MDAERKTHDDDWVAVDPEAFFAHAEVSREAWAAVQGGFVYHKSVGRARVETIDVRATQQESSLRLAVVSGDPRDWKNTLRRKVPLHDFDNGSIIGMLLPSHALQAMIERLGWHPTGLEPSKKLSEASMKNLARLREAAHSYGVSPARTRRVTRAEEPQRIRYERAKGERLERQPFIQQFCKERGIVQVVHFTRLTNVDCILRHGLLSRQELKQRLSPAELASVVLTDTQRLDGHQDAVCLSISFPNYRMFNKYRHEDGGAWAVLAMKPEVLWGLDCAFCQTNAASAAMKSAPAETRKTVEALKSMFYEPTNLTRQERGLPGRFTTNPQAEVLVFEPIAPSYISEVFFDSRAALIEWNARHSHQTATRVSCEPDYFRYRVDYKCWLSTPSQRPSDPCHWEPDDIPF